MEAGFEKGRPPPPWFEECPELLSGEEIYLLDFQELSTERGMGGPIPGSAITRLAKERGLDSRATYIYRSVIRAMDNCFLKWHESQNKRQQNASMRQAKRRTKRG